MEEKATTTTTVKKPIKRVQRKKVCAFCVEKATSIDYKDVNKLKKFVTEKGKMLPRRMTGVCAEHQRDLAEAIKKEKERLEVE